MNFLVPQGIGDSIWALTKLWSIATDHGKTDCHVSIGCSDPDNPGEARALEFVRRFDFVSSARMYKMPRDGRVGAVLLPGPATDEDGLFRYIADGPPPDLPGVNYVLMPNAPLERGIRLENWLPEHDIDWNVMRHFVRNPRDRDTVPAGDYAVLYMSSEGANTVAGHNRGGLWTPQDWADLGNGLAALGLKVVIVGAEYDRSYLEKYVLPLDRIGDWVDLVGHRDIGQTVEVLRRAKCVVSYQSGIGITASYLGVPTAIFWRAKGNSVNPDFYVSFDERMASAWAPPHMIDSGRHLPLIYGRCDARSVLHEIDSRRWL